jgi:hypothetical protein
VAVFIILFVLSFVVAGVHIYRYKEPRTGGRGSRDSVALASRDKHRVRGALCFLGARVRRGRSRGFIGWPAGNPFRRRWG